MLKYICNMFPSPHRRLHNKLHSFFVPRFSPLSILFHLISFVCIYWFGFFIFIQTVSSSSFFLHSGSSIHLNVFFSLRFSFRFLVDRLIMRACDSSTHWNHKRKSNEKKEEEEEKRILWIIIRWLLLQRQQQLLQRLQLWPQPQQQQWQRHHRRHHCQQP